MKKLLGLLLLLTSCSANSQFMEQNDVFTFFNQDRYYTQGIKYTTSSFDGDTRTNVGFGQDIYTPAKKQFKELIKNDRPYVGYLYGHAGYEIPRDEHIDVYDLEVGTIGPNAYGQEVQNGFHRLIGQNEAQGWANQLHNEVTVNGSYDRVIPGFAKTYAGNFKTFTYLGTDLGTVRTSANLGAEAQALLHQTKNFKLIAAMSGNSTYKIRDIFLDGNTFEDSHHVDKNAIVGSVRMGVQAEFHHWYLRFAYVEMSPEFQKQGDGYNYGSIFIGYNARVDFPILGW